MPKKRGRFIPCRGGGTATTYYTDHHEVDEEMMTVMLYGSDCGHWWGGTASGVFQRVMGQYFQQTASLDNAASRLIYLS